MASSTAKLLLFDDFEIDLSKRRLLKYGVPVPLKPKTFDLLLTLARNSGRVLTKDELLDEVWKDQFVEENNLTVHIAALRKALGETKKEHRFIVTVPGKGYSFVANVDEGRDRQFVVESHQFERIVVEEEYTETTDEISGTNGHISRVRAEPRPVVYTSARKPYLAVVLVCLTALVVGMGGYAFKNQLPAVFRSSPPPFATSSIKQLTTNGKVGSAALSPDGKMFVYTIDDIGQKSLWLGYINGGNHIQLKPPSEARYRSLTFSPDSSHIYYSLRDEKNQRAALCRMPAFGGPEEKLLDDVATFALSPDATHIAVGKDDKATGKDSLMLRPIDGSQPVTVTLSDPDLSFSYSSLAWSPDGRHIAMSALRNIKPYSNEVATVEILSGDVRRFPNDAVREITKTEWLADGSGLLVTAVEPTSLSSVPQYRIWHMNYPGGEISLVTNDRSNYGASWHNDAGVTLSTASDSNIVLGVEHRQLSNVWVAPADDLSAAKQITFSSFGKYDGLWGLDWVPDGTLIYTTSDTQSQFLATMNGDGTGQKAITARGKIDSVLTVTADGRYIIFHSDRGGDGFDIWRANIDGSDAKQLTFGGEGYQPAPSPDGKWVYYKSRLNLPGVLCRVPIDGGVPECLNDKETSWVSFSPDGKYFAAIYTTDKSRIAIFSAETNQIERQFDLPATGTFFMGSRWAPDNSAVDFRDTSYGYWRQPISGGDAYRIEGLPREKLYNFAWSKDGKWLAYVRGQEIRDVVLIQNTGN